MLPTALKSVHLAYTSTSILHLPPLFYDVT